MSPVPRCRASCFDLHLLLSPHHQADRLLVPRRRRARATVRSRLLLLLVRLPRALPRHARAAAAAAPAPRLHLHRAHRARGGTTTVESRHGLPVGCQPVFDARQRRGRRARGDACRAGARDSAATAAAAVLRAGSGPCLLGPPPLILQAALARRMTKAAIERDEISRSQVRCAADVLLGATCGLLQLY